MSEKASMRPIESLFLAIALLLTTAIHSAGAAETDVQYQYGSAKELKGVARLYVSTGSDLELRDQIAKVINSELGNLVVITDTATEAEVILTFDGAVQSLNDGMWKARWGNGSVSRVVDAHTIRLLLTYKRPKEAYRVGHHPADDFAHVFVNAFREANNLDRKNRPKA
jgi:hypothetical protein